MLKKAVVCIMLVAAAAMAWAPLVDVPHKASVDVGTHLVWGDGLVWGVFPSKDSQSPTYVFSFDPEADTENGAYPWDTSIVANMSLNPCNITFQPGVDTEPSALWGIGKLSSQSYLKHYFPNTHQWVSENINDFTLSAGACIAYRPNPSYIPGYIPGWLYCLAGGDSSFWRYGVKSFLMPDPSTYGYLYPDTGTTIANSTPTFRWNPGGQLYRVQVSTDSTFTAGLPLIDTVVTTNEYESTVNLTNGTYYWRVAGWSRGQWLWMTARHYWFTVTVGWIKLRSINHVIPSGAELAYDTASFTDGAPSIIAIYGHPSQHFARYTFGDNQWHYDWDDPPWNVSTGSSLTTNALIGGCPHILTSFCDETTNDFPYSFYPDSLTGHQWKEHIIDSTGGGPLWSSRFPEKLKEGSSMIIGASYMDYLTTGVDHNFYGLEPGGPSQREFYIEPTTRVKARVIGLLGKGIEVEYQLPAAACVHVVLHDAAGRRVGMLDAGKQKAGLHRLSWNCDQAGRKLSAGAYFVLIDTGTEQARLKTVVR